METVFPYYVTLLFGLFALLPLSVAHSFLTDPKPYNRVYKTVSCSGSECEQACPNLLRSGMRNTPSSPAAVWRRGQKVSIKWAKNNHRGGLIRMSLVPMHSMMSRNWHARLALWHGCWESGLYHCTGELCGADTDNEGFRREVTIPSVFPDGIYVAAMVWYGGLHYTRDKGRFPDSHSCSFVHISGGPVSAAYQPFWEAGDTGKFENGNLCQTATDEVSTCPKTGCIGPSFWSVAKEYKNGKIPEKITQSIVAAAVAKTAQFNVTNAAQPSPKSLVQHRGGRTRPPPRTQLSGASPTQSGGDTGSSFPPICAGDVCCAGSCGSCGGRDCNKLPGGASNCCYSKISTSGRKCGRDVPPCVKHR